MLKHLGFLAGALFLPLTVLAGELPVGIQLDIGVIIPLTGPLAEYGQAFQNGMELAKHDSPDVSKNCRFIVEDSLYDSKTAVSIFQKLVTVSHVPIIYNWGGPTSEAVAPLAGRNNVALFVWSADPAVAEKHENVIRFANSGADYGGTLANFLFDQGHRSVGIVAAENQYIGAILSGFQRGSQGKFSVEVIASHLPAEQDFRTTITRIKDRQYDAVGIFLLSGQVSTFVNQLQDQRIHLPLFGTDFFESMTEIKRSRGGMVGSVFANNKVTSDFRQTYVRQFGNDLQINHAANGYDFTKFMCETVKPQLKTLSSREILDRSVASHSVNGKQGTAIFTTSDLGDKYFRFPVVIRKITENAIVTEKE